MDPTPDHEASPEGFGAPMKPGLLAEALAQRRPPFWPFSASRDCPPPCPFSEHLASGSSSRNTFSFL